VITGTEDVQPVQMRAFDRRTGAVMWQREGGWALTRSDIVGVGNLAVGRNERGELVALDAETGEKEWHVPHDGARFRNHEAESPAVSGSDVVFSGPDGVLYSVDGDSGLLRWRANLDCDVSTSVAVEGDDIYVGCSTGRLYYVSESTGAILGALELDQPLEGRLLLLEDRIVVPGGRAWIGAVDRAVAGVLWARTDQAPLSVVQPISWRDAILTGNAEGTVLALSSEDGRTLWTLDLDGSIRGLGKEGDILLVGTIEGTVYALREAR
jgi:outer membrane protein assembly factor BamB